MTHASSSIERLDPNFAVKGVDDNLAWYDAQHLGIECRPFDDTPSPFARLPRRAQGVVRDPVWTLSLCSAGLCVRFITDASSLGLRWTLTKDQMAMPHMPATGVSGLDLYGRADDGQWTYCGTGRPDVTRAANESMEEACPTLGGDQPREYCLFLPLYNGAGEVAIGFAPDALVAKAPAWPAGVQKPIVCYGTSIVQGGCASRPGMAYPAILQRRLDRPVINLGFSGNGKSEPEVAQLLAEIDASLYLLDPLPNMTPDLIHERIGPLVRTLRQARPEAPIVLVESSPNLRPGGAALVEEKNRVLNAIYQSLLDEGIERLSIATGAELLGQDREGTVDGVHPTDLGFLRMANHLQPAIEAALKR